MSFEEPVGSEVDDAEGSQSDVEKVEEIVRDRIRTLRWKPGQSLFLTEIIEETGCGRTPLRLALERVARDGWLTLLPRRGVSVSTITISDFRALYEFVIPLSEILGRLAAEKIDSAGIQALADIQDRYRHAAESNDKEAKARLDTDFHTALVAITDNPYIINAFAKLIVQLERCSRICLVSRPDDLASSAWRDWLSETDAIVAALRARDPIAAAKATVAHAAAAKERQKAWL